MEDDRRGEEEAWDAWARGEARCPFCLNMSEEEFQAMCDCSRAHFEKTGEQAGIEVIGNPDSWGPIYPIQHER